MANVANVRLKCHLQMCQERKCSGGGCGTSTNVKKSSHSNLCSSHHKSRILSKHWSLRWQRDCFGRKAGAGVLSSKQERQNLLRQPRKIQGQSSGHSTLKLSRRCAAQASASTLPEDDRPLPEKEGSCLQEIGEAETDAGRGPAPQFPRSRWWVLGAVLAASLVTAVALGALAGAHPALAVSGGAGSPPGGLASMTAEAVVPVGEPAFTFNFFGFKGRLGEQTPGWIYFGLLMAAGFGLFVSEEALNVWVGATLGRSLAWDGSLNTLAAAVSANAPAVLSTVAWVYWGVCLSDMVPFFAGRWASKRGQAVKDKVLKNRQQLLRITEAIQKYGNLIGFVERFSVGVRNPTSFLAGAAGVAPEKFFAGVCLGGLFTLPIQLALGLACREKPLTALAVVATVVGTWSLVPIGIAALASVSLFMKKKSPGDAIDEEATLT